MKSQSLSNDGEKRTTKDHCVLTISFKIDEPKGPDSLVFHTYGPYTKVEAQRMRNQITKRLGIDVIARVRKLISATEVDARPEQLKG